MRLIILSVIVSLAVTSGAFGAYTLSPVVDGNSALSLTQGSMFDLDLVLTSDAGDTHDAALFTVEFSQPGIALTNYSWGSPYTTGGIDDYTEPGLGALPVALDANSYMDDPNFDPGAIDVMFENFIAVDPSFTVGSIVTLSLEIPCDFVLGDLTITAVPDFFSSNGTDIATTGEILTIDITKALIADIAPVATGGDGIVDGADLGALLARWKDTGPSIADIAPVASGGDGIVDGADLGALLARWKDTCSVSSAPAVPEPATMLLTAIGGLSLLRRRRRRS